MLEIICVGIGIAVLSAIGTGLIVTERKKHSLFPDDGIVWPESMEKWAKK